MDIAKKKSVDYPHWPQNVVYPQDNFYQSQLNFNLIVIYPAVIYLCFEQPGNLYKKALELTNLKANLLGSFSAVQAMVCD